MIYNPPVLKCKQISHLVFHTLCFGELAKHRKCSKIASGSTWKAREVCTCLGQWLEYRKLQRRLRDGTARRQKELDSGVTPRLRLQSEGVSLPLSLPHLLWLADSFSAWQRGKERNLKPHCSGSLLISSCEKICKRGKKRSFTIQLLKFRDINQEIIFL